MNNVVITEDVELLILRGIKEIREIQGIKDLLARLLLDEDLWSHSVRVSKIAVTVGMRCKLTEEDLFALAIGGLLHDIGKLDVPKKILYKPSKLTEEEFNVMRAHPLQGYKALINADFNNSKALDIVLHHHEKLDGTGYPEGISDISFLTRIVTVSDIFAALTEERCYHKRYSHADAQSLMKSMSNIEEGIVNTTLEMEEVI